MKRIVTILFLVLLFSAGATYAQLGNMAGTAAESAASGEELPLLIPNAFTPNDDGVNDVYYIPDANFLQFEFSVFDRWGNRVFYTNNPNFRWAGDSKGRPIPTGIYVFVLEGKSARGKNVKRSGTITVVR